MKHSLILASSAFFAALTSGSYAADAIMAQDAEPQFAASTATKPAFNWGGAYIGGQIDYSMLNGAFSFPGQPERKAKGRNFLGGLYTGYNFDVGNDLILGAELDVAGSAGKGREDIDNTEIFATTQNRWNGAARARIGYAADRFMPYLAGGLAFGGFKDRLKKPNSESTTNALRTGWTVGGGVDYAVTDNVILRAEYRYTNFGKQNFDFGNSTSYGRKFSSNDIRIGIAYKF